MTEARYDTIGSGYANTRREDPVIKRAITDTLGEVGSVVNVGAGAGSYEPNDKFVIAVEPSSVMVSQRAPDQPVAVRAVAAHLPLASASVDAAMTVLSLHHWHPGQFEGVMEMKRVARERVLIVTIDPVISGNMWLMSDYLPEVARLDHEIFPTIDTICDWLEVDCRVKTLPIRRDTPDWSLMSFWAHPERVLDDKARAATSGFARQSEAVNRRVVAAVKRDLESGAWDERYGHLRNLDEYDAGLRLIEAAF